jgi:hypothetical protein
MFSRILLIVAIALTAIGASLYAQQSDQRRATIRGGGGDLGKCTIEVVVDGVAEVEIRGDNANLRTLAGQPAQWRRFDAHGARTRLPG